MGIDLSSLEARESGNLWGVSLPSFGAMKDIIANN